MNAKTITTLLATAALGLSATANEIRYEVVPIGDYLNPNILYIEAYSINSHGEVTGYTTRDLPGQPNVASPYIFSEGGGYQDLGFPSNTGSATAYHINDSQMVVGRGGDANGIVRPYIHTPGTGYQFFGQNLDMINGINNSGTVVGTLSYPDSGDGSSARAFRYSAAGGLEDLGTMMGNSAGGNAINNLGWVVGNASTSTGVVAFLYRDGLGATQLWPGTARKINDRGTILGDMNVGSSSSSLQIVVSLNGQVANLQDPNFRAYELNNHDVVVGSARTVFGPTAYTWSAEEGLLDLNTLVSPDSGWHLGVAYDINDAGQIVGMGTYMGGPPRSFLLNPVPEPGTWALLALGGVTLGLVARQRRR